MPFVPEVELDFVKYIALRKGVVERRQKEGSAYAYSGEERVRKTLVWARPVTLAIEATVRLWQGVKRAELLGSSVKVTEQQHPRVWQAAVRCARTLGIDTPPVYLAPDLGQLGAQTLGTDEDFSIVLSGALVERLSDDELAFVIGHECGHIHAGHVIFTTALYYLKHAAAFYVRWSVQPAVLALQAWSRRAEITCDRAGLLCVKNLDVAVEATGKLALGSQKPFVPKRIEALRTFAKTELYRRHAGLGHDGIATHEADLEVSRLLSVI